MLSQEVVARKIGVSRPTYAQIEQGARDITVVEARKLADLFDLTLDDFLAEKNEGISVKIQAGKENSAKKEKAYCRIDVPQERADKFREVLLYILKKVGGKPNVGMTVLYKILYSIDFDYYEKYEEQLMGALNCFNMRPAT